jgi:transglutaminase-like putative cysteine protease
MQACLAVSLLITCALSLGCGPAPQPAAVPPTKPIIAPEPATSDNGAASPADADIAPLPGKPQTRRFAFHYKFRVKDLKPTGDAEQDQVRVWLPVPSTDDSQTVQRLPDVAPATIETKRETAAGNQYAYLQLPIPESGEFTVDLPYEIERREVRTAGKPGDAQPELDEATRAQLLAATKLVPTTGKPLELIKEVKLADEPIARARQLYNVVDKHVVYKKEGTGWGRGDTNWVCDSGYGNCTDFHSLFMSLARSQGLPAKFEIGFSIPTDKTSGPVAGYHCWAWFHTPKGGWVPVDISEADKHPEMKEYYFGNLTADRVTFSTGRDLQLEPAPAAGPLNFFVFPHIEVGGQVLPKEKLEMLTSFEDK